ncbi:MAG: kelch repeat-containing protein, partial [Candidatus Riflebacteria bacterium]
NGGTNNGIASNDDRNGAIKTFFGYFIPPVAIQEFATAYRDPYRIFINNNLMIENTTTSTNSSAEFTLAQSANSLNRLQINHKTNGGERLVGLFSLPAAAADITPAAPTSVAGDAHFDDDYNEISGYDKIASTSTRPFQFTPVHLCYYEVTGCNSNLSGMAFSRDASNPIFFYFDHIVDDIIVIKPGSPLTRIDAGSMSHLDRQFTVSPDGQTLIFAQDSGTYEIYMVDISNPDSTADNFSFDGGTYDWNSMTGFGRRIRTVSLTDQPTALATLPMNYHRSSAPNGTYVSIATMSAATFGCGNAAIASGGIYIMGGSPSSSPGAPTKNVLLFQPHLTGGPNIASVTANVLKKTVYAHSTAAYDNKIYVFGGGDGSAPTSWVQCYDLTTGKVISSFDPAATGATVELQVSFNQSSLPSPTAITDSGNTEFGDPGEEAFDGSVGSGYLWACTSNNQWVKYNSGNSSLRFVVNKIWVDNTISDTTMGVNGFTISGSNDDFSTTPYSESLNVSQNSSGWTSPLTNSSAFQYYKFQITSNHGGTRWAAREIKFFLTGLRKVPSVALTSAGPSPFTSSDGGNNSGNAAYKAFDNNNSTYFEADSCSNEWAGFYTGVSGGECLKYVRIKCNDSAGRLNNFWIEGANDPGFASSIAIPFADGAVTAAHPNSTTTFLYTLNNATNYRYYRLWIQSTHDGNNPRISEVEFYTDISGVTTPSEPIMTKMMNDVRSPLALQQGAACTTPFGIMVAGGVYAASQATGTAMIYWPHAIDYYNSATDMSFGISRSLPLLPQIVGNHNLVWHKGKVYRVGGNDTGNTNAGALDNINIFDFSTNSWATMTSNVGGFDTSYDFTRRNAAAACSLGDEIFIFGGLDAAGIRRIDGAAWNPTTNQVRKLGNLPKTSGSGGTYYHTVGMSAVPYGSFIYLIGGAGISTSAGSIGENNSVGKEIIKFSP